MLMSDPDGIRIAVKDITGRKQLNVIRLAPKATTRTLSYGQYLPEQPLISQLLLLFCDSSFQK